MSYHLHFTCFAKRINERRLLLGFIASRGPAGEKDIASTITANDGVFINTQVINGSEIYANNCASCHGRNLRGSEGGSALIGERFVSSWKNQNLDALFALTKNTMPKTNPK